MKYFYLLFGLVPALLAGSPALAQISIDEVDAKEDKVTFEDRLKSTSVDVDYVEPGPLQRPNAPQSARSATTSNSAAAYRVHSRHTTTRGSQSRAVTTPSP